MSLFIFLTVLSVLVIVHEWGHYISARTVGVKVEKFSVGFGPKIISRFRKGTEFLLSAIPLGGYVKMAGDERAECKGTTDEFYSHPPGHRAFVIVMGPVINFVFGFLCLWGVFMLGYPGQAMQVYGLRDGVAQVDGLAIGDRVVSINGKKLYSLPHLQRNLVGDDKSLISLGVLRDDKEIVLKVKPEIITETNYFGKDQLVRDLGIDFIGASIGALAEDLPALESGLEKGDLIISINDSKVTHWEKVQELIGEAGGQPIAIKVKRGDDVLQKTLTPQYEEELEKYIIGISPQHDFDYVNFGPITSFAYAYDEVMTITTMTYKALFYMITGSMSAKESVGGPVLIFNAVRMASQAGVVHLLFIMAVISISLAIFNLLPVPVLDGGHLFLLAIEKVKGKPLPTAWEENLTKVGMSLLICLMIFVFYNDLARLGWFDVVKDIFLRLKSAS